LDGTYRGFAFEGAAMAVALLDLLTPWNHGRFRALRDSPSGDAHYYMLHVGAGWAIARIPWARRHFERSMRRFHPLFGWLALDGYGFHEGFFRTSWYIGEQRAPRGLSEQAQKVFDQGLGRSLWFSHAGEADRLLATIARFDVTRRDDLWSGIGLGAAYAGGTERSELEQLYHLAGAYAAHLAQGASFAAKARARAGIPAPHTEMACNVFCRMSAEEAAALTDRFLHDLRADGAEPEYQQWRRQIREQFRSNFQYSAFGFRSEHKRSNSENRKPKPNVMSGL
jgi:hypothetical protein